MLDRRVALFGGTLLACGMASAEAAAQELVNIDNAQTASAYVYAYANPAAYAESTSPNGFAMSGVSGKNTLSATLSPAGLAASLSTTDTSYVMLNAGSIYALDVRFETSVDTKGLQIEWNFDEDAFFVPVREFRLEDSSGATIFQVSTFSPTDPRSGSLFIPVEKGTLFIFDLRMSYLGNVGTVFLTMTPLSTSPTCPSDLDGNDAVDAADLAVVLGNWGSAGLSDLDNSGTTDAGDIAILLGAWGNCPP